MCIVIPHSALGMEFLRKYLEIKILQKKGKGARKGERVKLRANDQIRMTIVSCLIITTFGTAEHCCNQACTKWPEEHVSIVNKVCEKKTMTNRRDLPGIAHITIRDCVQILLPGKVCYRGYVDNRRSNPVSIH
jgi:hypothetical protein